MLVGVGSSHASSPIAIASLVIFACFSPVNTASATTANPSSEQMPEALAPFVVNGRFQPRDFEWLRWRFSADPEESARWKQVMRWAGTRSEARKKAIAASLAAAGVDPNRARGDCFDDE